MQPGLKVSRGFDQFSTAALNFDPGSRNLRRVTHLSFPASCFAQYPRAAATPKVTTAAIKPPASGPTNVAKASARVMAKLWDLPVIYAIENNRYAMGTAVERSASEPLFYRRGESFRIPGIQVDGMDVLAVRGAAEEAMAWTQAGKGPIILELLTYRYRGHSMSDPAKYRSKEEVQDYREHHDPIDHAHLHHRL